MLKPNQNIVSFSIIFRKMNMWNNEQCIHLGLTAAQLPVIAAVCETGRISQNALVERLCLEKSVVAKTVAKLVEAGYIIRRQSTTDRRAYDLFPADKAFSVYPEIARISHACMEHLFQGLDEQEKEALSCLLKKVKANALRLSESDN